MRLVKKYPTQKGKITIVLPNVSVEIGIAMKVLLRKDMIIRMGYLVFPDEIGDTPKHAVQNKF